jgi:subtilase family serine protease
MNLIQQEGMNFFVFCLILFVQTGHGINNHMRGSEDRDIFAVDGNKVTKTHVFKRRITGHSRLGIAKRSRISPEINHEVVFVIKQRNMEELKRILYDVSDPYSINYGKHRTRQQVANLTANPISRDYLVSFLTSIGATIVSETLSGEYIKAKAPIRLWEEMFQTEFFMFHRTQDADHIDTFVRAEYYYLPASLDSHVQCVFNTVQMPLQLHGGPIEVSEPLDDVDNRNNKRRSQYTSFRNNLITPDKLKVILNRLNIPLDIDYCY